MERKQLTSGVYLTTLPAQKFKTSYLSAQLVTPLTETTAAKNALLPAVLRRGTLRYPDMQKIEAALDLLYGARIEYTVRKKGENQCIGFIASFIDDSFAPKGERLLEPVAQLLGELLLEPTTKGGRFLPAYVEGERANLIDAIRSVVNDKRDYADLRLLQEMCKGEAYGISRFGDEKSARHSTKLYTHYRELCESSRLELFYSGNADLTRVENALQEAFATLPRGELIAPVVTSEHPIAKEPRFLTETMDVTQGKLAMGFSCTTDDIPAMILANAIFGGTSNSKLFLHVREKLSLCYFASSQYHRHKGLVTVSSGIEFENYQRALDEIMAQLACVQAGQIEDWELTGARSTVLNSFRTLADSQGRLEDFYLGQSATNPNGEIDLLSPEDMIHAMEQTTRARVLEASGSIALDTVYFLKGKEEAR